MLNNINCKMVKQFIKGLTYIKNHNNADDNSDSLDFDSEYLNLPNIDMDELIQEFSDNVWDALNLTWQNNDNGGLYILPYEGHISSDDALTVNELLSKFKHLLHVAKVAPKEISQKSFNQIKLVAKVLQKLVHDDPNDYDLSNLSDDETKMVPDGNLAEFINSNADLVCAANLNIYFDDSEEMAFYSYQDAADPDEEPFTYKELLNRVNKLIKAGRRGIEHFCERNEMLEDKIMKIHDEMNVID